LALAWNVDAGYEYEVIRGAHLGTSDRWLIRQPIGNATGSAADFQARPTGAHAKVGQETLYLHRTGTQATMCPPEILCLLRNVPHA
jgi:hypothetical protein